MILSSLILQRTLQGAYVVYTTVVGENKYIIVQGVDMKRNEKQPLPPQPHPTSIRSEAPTYSSGEGGYLP